MQHTRRRQRHHTHFRVAREWQTRTSPYHLLMPTSSAARLTPSSWLPLKPLPSPCLPPTCGVPMKTSGGVSLPVEEMSEAVRCREA